MADGNAQCLAPTQRRWRWSKGKVRPLTTLTRSRANRITRSGRNPRPGRAPAGAPACRCAPARRAPFRRSGSALAGADHAPQDVGEPCARRRDRAVEPRPGGDLPLARRRARPPLAAIRTASQRIVIAGRELRASPNRRAAARRRRTGGRSRWPRACSQLSGDSARLTVTLRRLAATPHDAVALRAVSSRSTRLRCMRIAPVSVERDALAKSAML